ncbi:MAG: Amidohydrolase, partial [Bacteroidota bacterium]|nr:Amidohydrolase [Bacteroidota bacterium]
MISSCSGQDKADLIIVDGKIFTNNKDYPFAEAVAIREEIIIAVGTSEKIEGYIEKEKTRVIDAAGRLVIPGFNDAHVHFGPLDPDYIELRYTTDPSIITEEVKLQVAKSKPGELIKGGHWEHEMFTDKKWPAKELIDKVSPDNPVILSRADGHSILVNSYLLKISGITKDTPDPSGGEIMRDPVTREPTGILKENAMSLVRTEDIKSERTNEEEGSRTWQGYLLALKEAREYGVTSIQIPGNADFEAYEKLMKDGLLTSRIDIGKPLTGD